MAVISVWNTARWMSISLIPRKANRRSFCIQKSVGIVDAALMIVIVQGRLPSIGRWLSEATGKTKKPARLAEYSPRGHKKEFAVLVFELNKIRRQK
jgi:hypothetical protein